MSVPIRSCLQCEQSPAEVKRYETICGIEGGYEYRELEHEWPRHHWRDWSDAELKRAGILPHAYDRYRRESLLTLGYAACTDTIRGHNVCKTDDPEWGLVRGQSFECGAKDLPIPTSPNTRQEDTDG